MFAAVVRSTKNAVESVAAPETRGEVLTRYRRLRAISVQHHANAMKLVSRDAMLRNARRLGLAQGTLLILDDIEDMNLVFDLSIHTTERGRSRAIDRYARSAKLPRGSDEALVLDAMCRARFSLIEIERRHRSAGLIAKDRIRGTEYWLVDEGLESSVPDGFVLATRLFTPDSFSMMAGVFVPITFTLLRDVIAAVPQLHRKTPQESIDDRRFAEAFYRMAIAEGLTAQVRYQDTPPEAG
jgi:hypothetical protein